MSYKTAHSLDKIKINDIVLNDRNSSLQKIEISRRVARLGRQEMEQ